MGVKLKKSPANSLKASHGKKRAMEWNTTEPVVKKPCLNPGKQFLEALRGPNPLDALKNWLYLVSTSKERAQLDNETPKDEGPSGFHKPGSYIAPASQSVSHTPEETVPADSDGEELDQVLENEKHLNQEEQEESDELESCVEQIDSFLLAGGSPSDFIQILPSANDASYANCRHIFKAFSKVLLRISAVHRERIPKTFKLCQELLNSYAHVMKSMLEKSKSVIQRKLVLELFTAMVVLDTQLGKEILTLPFFKENIVQNLTSFFAPIELRIAYFNFLIALLMEASDSVIINAVINKSWLLTTIMDDLQYDTSQSLVMLLTTLQKSIVKNPHVSKTSKLVIFDVNTILCILRLYAWKGPQNRPRARSPYDVKKVAQQKRPLADIDSEEAEIIENAVHELLLLLLTDYRFGIIFRDPNIGFKDDRLNSHVLKVLQKVGQFWEHPKTAELISKVLAACPDAMSSTMASMESFVIPRSSPQWFKCVNFLKKVIEAQRPCEILERQASKLPPTKFSQAAVEMCAPPHVVKALCSGDASALCGDDTEVAKLTFELLICMLKKTSSFIDEIKLWSKKGILIKFVAIHHLLRDMMPQHFPSFFSVEKAWRHWNDKLNQTDDSNLNQAKDPSSVVTVLSSLMEFLDSYRCVSPAALEAFLSAQSSMKLSMNNIVLSLSDSGEGAVLRNNFYHLLLNVHDYFFTVENPEMREPLVHLFKDILSSSDHVQNLAFSVLQALIERSKLLEGSRGEAFIWLSTYRETFLGNQGLACELSEIIVESMMRATSQYSKYFDMIAQCEEQSHHTSGSSQGLFKDMLNSFRSSSVQKGDGGRIESFQSNSRSYNISSVSPWLPALIEVLKEKYDINKKRKRRHRQAFEKFLTLLIVRLLFRFMHPLPPLHLILRDACELLPCNLAEYLRSWLPGSEPQPLTSELLEQENNEVKLSMFLFSDSGGVCDQDTMVEIIKHATESSLPGRNGTQMNIIQMSYFGVFHLTQFTQLNALSKERAKSCREFLTFLLKIASQFECFGEKKTKRLSVECLEVVFSHPLLLQQFSPLVKHRTSSAQLLTDLLIALASAAKYDVPENAIVEPFKRKILSAIVSSVNLRAILKEDPVPMIHAFPLNFLEITELLDLLADLPSSFLYSSSNNRSELSHWCHLTVCLLSCLVDLRCKEMSDCKTLWVLSHSTLSKIASWVIQMLNISNLDCCSLQQALLTYIKSCPQHTKYVPKQLLPCLLNTNHLTSDGEHLVNWLSQHLGHQDVVNLLKENCKPGRCLWERPNILLPVLAATLKSDEAVGIVSSNLFKKIYNHLHLIIERSVTSVAEHPEWLQENMDVIVSLIEFGMSLEAREKICETLKDEAPPLSVENLYHLRLIVAVLRNRPSQLLRLLLKYLVEALKSHDIVGNQGPLVEHVCREILQNVKKSESSIVNIRESKEWQESIKFALKLSLRLSDYGPISEYESNDEISKENPIPEENDVSSQLLKVLSHLFLVLYSPEEDHEHVGMVYKLTTLHSEFVNTMMDCSPSKLELVHLLHTLVTLCPSTVDSAHVPVILAAYGATLSRTDCALLRLLQAYERTGICLSQYRPYLWGKEGANHYSVWSDTSVESGHTLWRQPKPDQVLRLLRQELIKSTIANFPLNRSLNIEKDTSDPLDNVYDPSFYLPLFSHLLAPESPVRILHFVRSGALAITFSCLASYDVAVRAAAYTTLARFLSHLHMSSGSDKEVLLHLMSAVQKGVLSFGEQNPQLPSISSVFLAEAALELAKPLSKVYHSLMHFFLANPVVKLNTVPEFWTFLHSETVHHSDHRNWILHVVSSGLRTRADFELCLKVVAFKLLPTFYSSCLSNTETKFLILRCLRSAVQDQYGACCLVRDYALISWLHQTILGFSGDDTHLISEMINIIRILWKSLCLPVCPTIPQVLQPANKVMLVVLALLPKISAQLGTTSLIHFICTLSSLIKALKSDIQKYACSGGEIFALIDVCSPFIKNCRELYEISQLGCEFVDSDNSFELLDEPISFEGKKLYYRENLQEYLRYLLMLWVRQVKPDIKMGRR